MAGAVFVEAKRLHSLSKSQAL